MSNGLYGELIGLCGGALLLTAVLVVWFRSPRAAILALGAQGVSLAILVGVIAVRRADAELIAVFVLVLVVKGVVLPWILARRLRRVSFPAPDTTNDTPLLNPVASLVSAALLAVLAYAVGWPLVADGGIAAHAAPIGLAMVLIGFLVLVSRRQAISQLIGFLVLDNGIATVAFLISGGVPRLLEFGASLDVLLVLLILQLFTHRLRAAHGSTDVDRLRELHD